MMPNVKTNLIKCEYSLKATSYFDYSVLGKDRLRIEMLIYVTHQLQKEYEYERDTNQNNGQGQEFTPRDFQKGFYAYGKIILIGEIIIIIVGETTIIQQFW